MSETGQGIVFFVFGIFFLGGGIIAQIIYWKEIEPTLRKMGYQYDPRTLRYPNGHYATLKQYKRNRIENGLSLKWWNYYWGSLGASIFVWLLWIFLVFGTDVFPKSHSRENRGVRTLTKPPIDQPLQNSK